MTLYINILIFYLQKSRDPWVFNKYIDDKYKIKIVYLLLKALRFHAQNTRLTSLAASPPLNSFVRATSQHFIKPFVSSASFNDQLIGVCKILTKSLQGLENLIASIQRMPGEQSQSHTLNWLQAHTEYFQLGDILANAKVG